MAIPDYQFFMRPVLELLSTQGDLRLRDLTARIANQVGLSDAERQELLPSGQQTVISNRVSWAKTYLRKAGLVEAPSRGIIRITDEGRKVLRQNATEISAKFLERYPSFVDFKDKRREPDNDDDVNTAIVATETPEEALDSAYSDIQSALADEVLESVKGCSPEFFERLVVELLVAMGYGGSIADAGRRIGRVGDGGIDGIINEDKLGLDIVCIQAKRWNENSVGRPTVQAFAGSMEAFRAKKGVLITTSSFSKDAVDFVDRIERKIVLIDGERLAKLMIEHGIGVTTVRQYSVKRIDSDYFSD